MYPLSKKQISEYKELFLLFDKNEDGVLSFPELGVAIRTLGLRIPGILLGLQSTFGDKNDILSREKVALYGERSQRGHSS